MITTLKSVRILTWFMAFVAVVPLADAQSHDISHEQLNEYCRRLRLDEEQLAVAKELFDEHVADCAQIRQSTRVLREEHMAKVREEGASRKSSVEGFEIEVQGEEERTKLNWALLNDLRLLQTPSGTSDEDWESAKRCFQIDAARTICSPHRSRFDLPRIVSKFDPADAQRLTIEMDAYERELVVQARRMISLDELASVAYPRVYDEDGGRPRMEQESRSAKIHLRLAETAITIGEIQWKYAARFENCLSETDQPRFRREVYAASCPRLLIADIEKTVPVAVSSQEIEPETRLALLRLSRDFDKRSAKAIAELSDSHWEVNCVGARHQFEPEKEKKIERETSALEAFTVARKEWEALQLEFEEKLKEILDRN